MVSFTKYSDSELIALLKQGNSNAFTEVYNRYWDKLYIVAANKLNDEYLAEEVVQDIFLDIWKRKEMLGLLHNIGSYLGAALKYKIINIRHRRTIEQRYQDASENLELYYSMENYLQFDELKDRLEKLVAQLPEKCQLIYKLSRDEGIPQKRIAQMLNIAEKTVEAHLTRALKALRSGIKMIISYILHSKFPNLQRRA
ncbi:MULTISPECIES: RNA polymerase sigma-70 factor [unclassified Sphingobacterium]|uniref:RNA polymerase sigma-70 factor n=1 Tax=unclassified Sphingobacterium TaxID=2609468 RepID=UPI0025DC9781|nr:MULTISPECIES: RNA polymerase sigma-70 factor [unclassified Sphingobacterium]